MVIVAGEFNPGNWSVRFSVTLLVGRTCHPVFLGRLASKDCDQGQTIPFLYFPHLNKKQITFPLSMSLSGLPRTHMSKIPHWAVLVSRADLDFWVVIIRKGRLNHSIIQKTLITNLIRAGEDTKGE